MDDAGNIVHVSCRKHESRETPANDIVNEIIDDEMFVKPHCIRTMLVFAKEKKKGFDARSLRGESSTADIDQGTLTVESKHFSQRCRR